MPETKNSSSSEKTHALAITADELSELLLYVWLRSEVGECIDLPAYSAAS